jgi:hypothetical protein
MPDEYRIPEIMRLMLEDAARKRSPQEEDAARRFLLGHATVAEYLAARLPNKT